MNSFFANFCLPQMSTGYPRRHLGAPTTLSKEWNFMNNWHSTDQQQIAEREAKIFSHWFLYCQMRKINTWLWNFQMKSEKCFPLNCKHAQLCSAWANNKMNERKRGRKHKSCDDFRVLSCENICKENNKNKNEQRNTNKRMTMAEKSMHKVDRFSPKNFWFAGIPRKHTHTHAHVYYAFEMHDFVPNPKSFEIIES